MSHQTVLQVGRWMARKWAARLDESDRDYFTVATQMRKQGIPLEIALALLLGRAEA